MQTMSYLSVIYTHKYSLMLPSTLSIFFLLHCVLPFICCVTAMAVSHFLATLCATDYFPFSFHQCEMPVISGLSFVAKQYNSIILFFRSLAMLQKHLQIFLILCCKHQSSGIVNGAICLTCLLNLCILFSLLPFQERIDEHQPCLPLKFIQSEPGAPS